MRFLLAAAGPYYIIRASKNPPAVACVVNHAVTSGENPEFVAGLQRY